METLDVRLKDCYGINLLEYDFKFKDKNMYMIYAPNGTMKTSFAKTFKDIMNGQMPKEQIKGSDGEYSLITDEGELDAEKIFVINSYEETYQCKNLSKLLLKNEIKEEYDRLVKEIETAKDVFLKKVLETFGGKKNSLESEFNKFYEKKLSVKNIIDIEREDIKIIQNLNYKYLEIFNDKAIALMKKRTFQENIEKYIDLYDELLENSKLFKKGGINHNNFDEIIKSIEKNRFFSIDNKLILANGKEVSNDTEFKEALEEEKNNILADKNLLKIFQSIDRLLKNQETKKLREILEEKPELILELENLELFQRKIWKSYFLLGEEEYKKLKEKYEENYGKITNILEKAKAEKTLWEETIEKFNQRFQLPFEVQIENKENVLVGIEEPRINFIYSGKKLSGQELKNDILSTGEKRAFYLLEITYEIENLKKENKEKLLILDDIADSFDYKNKYAIIEYLNDLLKEENFKIIILTHNFDFYRTIASRLELQKNSLIALKSNGEIKLEKGQYFKSVFTYWKPKILSNEKLLVATIPFVRNLIEYSIGAKDETGDWDKNYIFLTNLLHYKFEDTESIKVEDLKNCYITSWFHNGEKIKNDGRKVIDVLFNESEKLIKNTQESINLEDKILLSMACRLRCEKNMFKDILEKDSSYKSKDKNQTRDLTDKYKELKLNKDNLNLIEEVNLMTAENIHLNSFMYEPLIDISSNHLKNLYENLKNNWR
ncbi:MAG: hypothetical protein Q7K47_06425 [Fusobacterium sp. JB019]|nr:hypothetical protein [Fusobacterium sp. JB019]